MATKRRYHVPAGWPDAATLAYYLPMVAALGARLALANPAPVEAAAQAKPAAERPKPEETPDSDY